jgi:hypothetical protein
MQADFNIWYTNLLSRLRKVLTLQQHLVTPHLVITQEEVIIVVPLGAHNIIDRDLCGTHGRIKLIDESELPIIPAEVSLTLARVDNIDINLSIIMLRLLPFHGAFMTSAVHNSGPASIPPLS